MRVWAGPDATRLVFDINSAVEHSVFVLKQPDRVVIDMKQSRFAETTTNPDLSSSLISGIRSAARNQSDLRVVLDLKAPVNPVSFVLEPAQGYGHRLVLDLKQNNSMPATSVVHAPDLFAGDKARPVIIAIDAGHGGEDPGAIGQRGTHEKVVVLQIARKLQQLIQGERGMKAVMIRNGDYYVSLRERTNKASELEADLFVSVHADAVRNGDASGASVYVLSQEGASSEAASLLAANENRADLIGGVFDEKDDMLVSVLLDLTQNATLVASSEVADKVLSEIGRVNTVHKPEVEQAGFVVLKSPKIPSILIETGFISNRKEEQQLKSSQFQARVANAVFRGVRSYFRKNPPPGTVLAQDRHQYQIKSGDTLGAIAKRYRVSLAALRSRNRLNDDTLQVGQILRIPSLN